MRTAPSGVNETGLVWLAIVAIVRYNDLDTLGNMKMGEMEVSNQVEPCLLASFLDLRNNQIKIDRDFHMVDHKFRFIMTW